MADEWPYELPDGEQVNVIRPEIAAGHLAKLVRNYGTGFSSPMVIGDDKPLGVVIPFEQWLEYLELLDDGTDELEEQDAADRRADMVRDRKRTREEDYTDVEDLLEELGDDGA